MLVMRTLVALVIIVSVCAALPTHASDAQYNAASWQEDFLQLRAAVSEHYANLRWAAQVRHTDLALLVQTTAAAISAAKTNDEAQTALQSFVDALGDGHLVLDWPQSDESAPRSMPASLCARLGYAENPPDPGLYFEKLPQYRSVTSTTARYFPLYALALPDGGNIGVLRIGIFMATGYPELCDLALAELRLTSSSPCDDSCADRVQIAAENELTKKLTDSITTLERLPRLRLLVVDVTANGGGSQWLEPAMRELTAARLRSPVMGFIKHEHWQSEFDRRLEAIRADLPRSSGQYRALLVQAQHVYEHLDDLAKEHCDQAPLWQDKEIDCDLVAHGNMYTTGILPYAAPGTLPGVTSAQYIFLPSKYIYHEGVYRGPLAVLVDQDSASATERVAAILQDNKAATLVGTPTYGAGCGYTNGGIPTELAHSNAKVEMPDCVQFRTDGTNAVAGITPDVLVPWRDNDNRYLRAKRAYDALVRVAQGTPSEI